MDTFFTVRWNGPAHAEMYSGVEYDMRWLPHAALTALASAVTLELTDRERVHQEAKHADPALLRTTLAALEARAREIMVNARGLQRELFVLTGQHVGISGDLPPDPA